MRSWAKAAICAGFLLLANGAIGDQQVQDVVYLHNGSVVRGDIVEQIPHQHIKIRTADGSVFVYAMDAIQKITREPVVGTTAPRAARRADEFPPGAQGKDYADAGVVEFGGSGAFVRDAYVSNGVAAETASLSIGMSPEILIFIADGLYLGVSPLSLSYFTQGSVRSVSYGLVALVGCALRMTPTVYPFVEAEAGYWGGSYESGSTSHSFDPDVAVGGQAGFKFLVGQSGLLTLGASYRMSARSASFGTSRTGYNTLTLSFGWSVFF